MKCHGSKFLVIAILTFLVGVGVVQVWQSFSYQSSLEPIRNNLQNKEQISDNQRLEPDFCEEIKKDPKYPYRPAFEKSVKLNPHLLSAGVLNQKVCQPLPYRQIDPKTRDYTKEYVVVQVVVDENGLVISASLVTPHKKFARRFERIAKGLRVRPPFLSGRYVNSTGVLVFYPNEDYSKS